MEPRFADAIVVAAGASKRMGGVDKLQADLLGRPLLSWSVEAMARARSVRRVIVVAAAEQVEQLSRHAWLRDAAAEAPDGVRVVQGGQRRSDSVRAGLAATRAAVIIVHDGARPLASPALADAVAAEAARVGGAIPVIPVPDSLRRVAAGRVTALLERDDLAAAQTPQAAQRALLEAAFDATTPEQLFTDEAAVLAAHGVPVATVPGEASNLKVTQPVDLELARTLLAARLGRVATATGFGQDSHPFGPDDGLWLGGVLIEQAPRLHGHSDGDAALHALATAILAAARLGDLGRHFPPADRRTSGAASARLLASVRERVAVAGWRPASAQVSVLGARPRLGAERVEEMRTRIGELLGLDPSAVAVIASSGNLAGPEGAGLAISASAFVTLVR